MRRAIAAVVALLTFGAVMFAVSAQPQSKTKSPSFKVPNDCTRVGKSTRDVMTGRAIRDVLCSVGGNDYDHGAGGQDLIRAGAGKDTLIGGQGRDVMKGGGGNDRIFATDSRGGERLVGGPGRDQCFGDREDHMFSCERVFVSYNRKQTAALENVTLGVMTIIDELAPPIPPIPPAPTTVTVTVTLPPPLGACDDPSAPQPDPFCGSPASGA